MGYIYVILEENGDKRLRNDKMKSFKKGRRKNCN